MAAWVPYAAQAAASVLGHIFGNKSRRNAEEEARAMSAWAVRAGGSALRRTMRRVSERVDREASRAENRLNVLSGRFERQSDRLADKTLSVSKAAATAERAQVIEDESTRFVRLREAAEAGGFNPLTVLQSGFTGAALPTGLLSADWHLAHGGMRADMLTAGATTRMNLDGQIQGQRIQGAIEGVSLGLNAQQIMHDQIMTGHEVAVQSGQAAYERSANVWRDVGNIAVSAWDARTQEVQHAAQVGLERERLDLDRQRFDYERSFNDRQLALATAGSGRGAGFGSARVGSWSEPILSNDAPTFQMNGRTYEGNPNVDSEENIGAAVGQMGGEAIKLAANLPQIDKALQDLVLWDPLRAYQDAFRNRESRAGAAWGAVADLWEDFTSNSPSATMSPQEMDNYVPSWAR